MKKFIKNALSITLSAAMAAGLAVGLGSAGATDVYAKTIGSKNEDAKARVEAVIDGTTPSFRDYSSDEAGKPGSHSDNLTGQTINGETISGYTDGYSNESIPYEDLLGDDTVFRGGNSLSRLNTGSPIDNDVTDFASVLPYGTVYIDTSKITFAEKNKGNFLVDIQDPRFAWAANHDAIATDAYPAAQNTVDAAGNSPTIITGNNSTGTSATNRDASNGIVYRGDLTAYLSNTQAYIDTPKGADGLPANYDWLYNNQTDAGVQNVIEPATSDGYLYRFVFYDAAILPDGTKGDLEVKTKKLTMESSIDARNVIIAVQDANMLEVGASINVIWDKDQDLDKYDPNNYIDDENDPDYPKSMIKLEKDATAGGTAANRGLADRYSYPATVTTTSGTSIATAVGTQTEIEIVVRDKEGNPVPGEISYAMTDLDIRTFQSYWGRPANTWRNTEHPGYGTPDALMADNMYAEGVTITGGSLSYAVTPRYEHYEGEDAAHGKIQGQEWYDEYKMPLWVERAAPATEKNANGVRFRTTNVNSRRNWDGRYSATTNVANGYFDRQQRNDGGTAGSFDSGFATLLNSEKTTMTWTGSTQSQMATKLFDTSSFTFVEQSHGTGGGIYLEGYKLSNAEPVMHEGSVTMGLSEKPTVTAVPEDGYRIKRILVSDVDRTDGTLSNTKEYSIVYEYDNTTGEYTPTGISNGGTTVNLDDENKATINGITFEVNSDGTVDVTLSDVTTPKHVHVDFDADYYFYKVWKGGEPTKLNMTAEPTAYIFTDVTLPAPTGFNTEGIMEYGDDEFFTIDGAGYSGDNGTELKLSNTGQLIWVHDETDPATGDPVTREDTTRYRLIGSEIVYSVVIGIDDTDPDNPKPIYEERRVPITVEYGVSSLAPRTFTVDNTEDYADYVTETTDSEGNIVWKIRYPASGVTSLGWPALPIEAEPDEHDINHVERNYWFVTEEAPGWSVQEYDNSNAKAPGVVKAPAGTTDPNYYGYMGTDGVWHGANWAASSVMHTEDATKLIQETYKHNNAFMSVFKDGGEIINSPAAVVKGTKQWEDRDNIYETRKDIWLHIDSKYTNADGQEISKEDVLPARKIAEDAPAEALSVFWGTHEAYVQDATDTKTVTVKTDANTANHRITIGNDNVIVVGSMDERPTHIGGYHISWTENGDGSFKGTDKNNRVYTLWVNELLKSYDNCKITYTVRETLDKEGLVPVEGGDALKGLTGYITDDGRDAVETVQDENEKTYKIGGDDEWEVDLYKGTVKNTLKEIDVAAVKVWDDNNDQDGYRSDVTFTLGRNGENGWEALPEKILTTTGINPEFNISKDATGDDLGTTWNKLPYIYDGKKVEYLVKEDISENAGEYTVTGNTPDDAAEDTDKNLSYTIKNTHVPETASISIFKKWDDGNNQDALRKIGATVLLEGKTESEAQYRAVSMQDGTGIVKGEVPTHDGLIVTYLNLPVKRNGGVITYKIAEDVSALGGYFTEIDYASETFELTKGQNKEALITNKQDPEVSEFTITKKWDDVDNHDGIRPDSVTIQLVKQYMDITDKTKEADKNVVVNGVEYVVRKANGIEFYQYGIKYYVADSDVQSFVVNPDDNKEIQVFAPTAGDPTAKVDKMWTIDGNRVDVYVDANNVEYCIYNGKYCDADGNEKEGFTPAGEPRKAQTDKTVTVDGTTYTIKVIGGTEYYQKDSKYYGIAGNELTVFDPTGAEVVKINVADTPDYTYTTDTQDIKLTAADAVDGNEDEWSTTIQLPVNAREGQNIVYTVKEDDVPEGYTATVTKKEAGKFEVTNKHVPVINPPVAKDDVSENWRGKTQTGTPSITADPDTLAPGGGKNVITKIELIDPETGEPTDKTEITVPGEGTYKLITKTDEDGNTTCEIEFTPEKDFVGKTKGIKVRGTDSNGQSADATYTPAVKMKVDYKDPLNENPDEVVDEGDTEKDKSGSDIDTDYEDKPGQESKHHPGYRFDGWEEEETEDPEYGTILVRRAKYTPLYDINYDPNGGTGSMDDDKYAADDPEKPSKENAFEKRGYTFEGFKAYITDPETGKETPITDKSGNPIIFKGPSDMSEYFENMPGGTSIRMEAQWRPNNYRINYDANGGSGSMASQDFTGEDKEAESKPNEFTRDGYKFTGFKAKDKDGNYLKDPDGKDLLFKAPNDFIEYLHDQGDGGEITLEAQWDKKPHAIWIDPATGRVIKETTDFDDEGNEPTPPTDPTREGYTFDGWDRYVDREGNVVYTAKWIPDEKPTYTVTYLDPATGRIIQETITVNEGDPEPASPADPTREGYTFDGWDRVVDEDGNITYLAKWKPVEEPEEKTYNVTYVDPATGRTIQETITVKEGDPEPAAPADPTREGYTFDGWERFVDKDGNIIYTAKWIPEEKPEPEENTYTVIYIDPATGRIVQETITVKEGDPEPAAPADPTREGYTFDGWDRIVDGEGNITYLAKWKPIEEPKTYTVIYIDPSTGRIIKEAVTVTEGDPEPAAPADPTREGYTFDGWDRTVDKDGNIIYTAKWLASGETPKGKTYTVTYIDPATGRIIQASITVNEGEEEPPAPEDPTREGYIFDGWDMIVDDEGNIIYMARWKSTTESKDVTEVVSNKTGNVNTGDRSGMYLWIAVASAGAAAAVITGTVLYRRKKD